jgi:S1-C subfamily serine protease
VIDRKEQVAKLRTGQVPAADIAPSGYGSGLLIKGGYVVTCWHVVDKAQKISVSCQGKDFVASVVQKDIGNDIAILRVDGADAGASLSFADSVKLGAQVFTMGFPHPGLQGSDVKFTTGSISGLTGPGNTPVYFQISAPLQSGNSGGPLFDEYGNLVGIVAAKLDSLKMLAATGDLTQNVNYAIKSDYLVPLLKTVDGIKIQPSQTKPVNLLSLVEELKKSVVMIKVY